VKRLKTNSWIALVKERYLPRHGSRFRNRAISRGLAAGLPPAGFDRAVVVLSPFEAAARGNAGPCDSPEPGFGNSAFPDPGNPPITLACGIAGTLPASFLTSMEILRLDGSNGLAFTRSIWSA
jgi:hypothetical protein